jgi:16S rRNA (guanine527-N7)-methyltransferase
MRDEFIKSIEKFQPEFDLNLSNDKISVLADYYEFVLENNVFLHLVAPSTPEDFAVRHILESVYATKFLPQNIRFADIGTGAGLPAVPCLIVREDLCGLLIESKLKKADFLDQVLSKFELENRAEIFRRQFEELQTPRVSYVLCRALDKFTKKLPKIVNWSEKSQFIFFGGNNLFEVLQTSKISFKKILLPMSEQRFIFVSN